MYSKMVSALEKTIKQRSGVGNVGNGRYDFNSKSNGQSKSY